MISKLNQPPGTGCIKLDLAFREVKVYRLIARYEDVRENPEQKLTRGYKAHFQRLFVILDDKVSVSNALEIEDDALKSTVRGTQESHWAMFSTYMQGWLYRTRAVLLEGT
ncbi:uncharacterized protein N7529_000979 [Penicillium soppii]|uniref:uncharacterized protein n=1 Tax=Penicillium soppii TaxID=69789 RepID=UPI00254886DC|nr:uncharacterized protein N7529_000979 [Penicillium soppii]KAJ5882307.1 hypothetical protein N7529_000979 [Penicillium soppii]